MKATSQAMRISSLVKGFWKAASIALTLGLGLSVARGADAGYYPVDITSALTENHSVVSDNNGFKTFYSTSSVEYQIGTQRIPFQISQNYLNIASSTVVGTEILRFEGTNTALGMPGNSKVYMLGLGTWLADYLGHAGFLFCSPDCNEEHLVFTVLYTDGTSDRVFPTDAITGRQEWSDIFNDVGAVDAFDWWYSTDHDGTTNGYIHAYSIDINPNKVVSCIFMHDQAGGYVTWGDYSVVAMTVYNPSASNQPHLTSVSPNSAKVGSKAMTVTLKGTNMTPNTRVFWTSYDRWGNPVESMRTSTYISPTQMTVQLNKADFAKAGGYKIRAMNPNPFGKGSNYLPFVVGSPKLNVKVSLVWNSGHIDAQVTLTNNGAAVASNLTITKVVLGTEPTQTKLPLLLGDIETGKSLSSNFMFGNRVPGTRTKLTIAGTYIGGSFSSTVLVQTP